MQDRLAETIPNKKGRGQKQKKIFPWWLQIDCPNIPHHESLEESVIGSPQ